VCVRVCLAVKVFLISDHLTRNLQAKQ